MSSAKTIDQTFELAKERHLAGDLSAAQELYDRVLAEQPGNAAVLYRIGLLEMQQGRYVEAAGWVERAIGLTPEDSRFYLGLGQILSELKRFGEAAGAYRKVIALGKGSADVNFALGLALQSQGDLAGAIGAYRDALKIQPDLAIALTNLGAALQGVGRFDEAVEPLTAAVRIEPGAAQHYVNLGAVFCQQRKFSEAVGVLRRALELNPNFPEAAFNLGNALGGLGQLQDAASAYRKAITLNPKYADAYNNLGVVCKELGEFKASAAAFDAAINVQPGFVPAYNNAGSLLRTLGRFDEAETVLRKPIELGVKSAAIFNNLAGVLKDGGALDEAIDCYRRALELNPNGVDIHSNLAYTLSFAATEGRLALEECQRWNDRHAVALRPKFQKYENDPSANRRLRIGYVSGDFRDHCQTLFTVPLLSHHDHKNFEIFCYASIERPDEYTKRLAGYADVWRDVRVLSDGEIAELIRRDRIDILVDLGMHMATSRPLVFARAPAPVQIAWLAYPGTTGISTIGYRLTDPRLDPAGFDEQYTEESIRLPDSFWCYDSLSQEQINPLPAMRNGFVTFGCLNNPCKLTDQTLRMWNGVMKGVPSARLLLMAPPGRSRQRLSDRLAKHGIAAERVSFEQFRPRAQYLQTYHQIDLGLDTFPYNGHTTSLDSFWMGVPVVTRVGQTAVGRGGLSQLHNLGLTELAAESDERFVEITVALANDLPRLAQLRETLRQRMERSPLMDGEKFARNIEAVYRRLWERRGLDTIQAT